MSLFNIDQLVAKSSIVPKHIREEYKQKIHASQKDINRLRQKVNNSNTRLLTGGLTLSIVQSVYEDNIKKFGCLTCIICGKPITFSDDSLEHNIPISRGGKNHYNNLSVSHLKCNHRKGDMTLIEWDIEEATKKLLRKL